MKKKYTFLLLFLIATVTNAQVTYTANGGTSFAGPLGTSSMSITHDATNIYFNITKGTNSTFDNFLVLYIDNGTTGRTVIDGDVNDLLDSHRKAISKSNSGDLNFPPGFEATHAIAVADNFGGVWAIPATGTISNNQLVYTESVGSSNGPTEFTMTLGWNDLGLTSTDSIQFLGYYGNPNDSNDQTYSSNEGYGDGILNNGNQNAYGAMTFTTYFDYPSGDKYGIATTSAIPSLWSLNSSWTNGNPPSAADEITINNNIAMDVDFTVDNSLTVNTGATVGVQADQIFTLNGALNVSTPLGQFGFDSDVTGSAQFINGPAASITGEVGVARFVPANTNGRRAFRFISSSVTTTLSIYQNWQTGGQSLAGTGTHITGSTSGANGFDQTTTGNPSLLFYGLDASDSTYKWQFVQNTNTNTLTAGQAYNIFVRGDRNYDLTANPAPAPNSDVKIPTRGILELGITVNSGALNPNAGGFSFVGNPYQATIDMSTVTKNNINDNFVYIWNPNAATEGAYETIDMSAASTDPKRFIQPGQSFFVSTIAAGAASLDVKATDKNVSENAAGSFSTPNNRPKIDLSLFRALNGSPVIFDRLQLFLDGDNELGLNDALKIENFEESLSRNLNGTLLSIENKTMPVHDEVVNLDLKNIASTDYTLTIDLNNLNLGLQAVLHDSFLNSDTVLVAGSNTVALNFDLSNASSIDASRFELRFVDTTLSVSNVNNFSFNMYPNPSSDGQVILRGNFEQGATQAVFYNTLGQQVLTSKVTSNEATINVQSLDSGIYLVKVISGSDTITKKLVIK